MKNINLVPCEDCQMAFRSHAGLHYLYCGHNRIIAFRIAGRPVAFLPVTSTSEAMQIIEQSGAASVLFAESA
jgi:hypothetical protein